MSYHTGPDRLRAYRNTGRFLSEDFLKAIDDTLLYVKHLEAVEKEFRKAFKEDTGDGGYIDD